MKSYFHSRLASFRYAFAGIGRLLKETNFSIHLVIAGLTVVAGILCRLSVLEWCAIFICFGLVLSAEGLNTAIEILADRVCSRKDESIKLVKDVAAGAVLISAIVAFVVGVLIFSARLL